MDRLRALAAYLWNFRYLPLRYRWPLIKLRRRLLPAQSPLGLRRSVRYARSLRHPPPPRGPLLFVLALLWPLPSWEFPAARPPPPRRVAADPGAADLRLLRIMPLWRARDTPLRVLYRLYEAVCARDGNLIATEVQYFWCRTGWATADIPDPGRDQVGGEEQYAVLAATAEMLVECFNWRLQMGLRRNDPLFMNAYKEPPEAEAETCPSWTATAGVLPEKLLLGRSAAYMDSPFHRRNIYIATGDFYSV